MRHIFLKGRTSLCCDEVLEVVREPEGGIRARCAKCGQRALHANLMTLTPPQVAGLLRVDYGVTARTVQNWCITGKLPALRSPSQRWRVTVVALDAFIRRGGP